MQPLTYEDIEAVDPDFYRTLRWALGRRGPGICQGKGLGRGGSGKLGTQGMHALRAALLPLTYAETAGLPGRALQGGGAADDLPSPCPDCGMPTPPSTTTIHPR